MTPSISAQGLTKIYPPQRSLFSRKPDAAEVVAVRDLSFTIAQGELVAFLGPNGAGKSTTIKMLCGILAPTRGTATVLGLPAGSRAANASLGLVFGTRSQLYLHMKVRQSLDLIAEIYGVVGADKLRRIDELTEAFDVRRFLEQRVRALSLGERMRCELVAALIHRPRVLLADEPTIGLDVVAKNRLRQLIREWQAVSGTTLMLTSHDLSDVEALTKRCILIDKGALQFDGPMSAVKGELEWVRRFTVTTRDARGAFAADPRMRALESGERFVHRYELDARQLPMHEAVQRLTAHYGDGLQDVRIEEVSLEEVLGARYGAAAQRAEA